MNKVKANIENLSSLWKSVSEPFQTYYEGDGFAYSRIPDSQWPNRIWSTEKDLTPYLNNIIEIMNNDNSSPILTYFDSGTPNNNREKILMASESLMERWVQYGMSMPLNQSFGKSPRLHFELIKNTDEAKLWCDVFKQSFGYKISRETLFNSYQKIDYFNVYYENKAIGTTILYITNGVAGIHSLGIIPQMRGKGFAREAMHFILNLALEKKAVLTTLQASKMAKNMYESIGFQTQFVVRNYQLEY